MGAQDFSSWLKEWKLAAKPGAWTGILGVLKTRRIDLSTDGEVIRIRPKDALTSDELAVILAHKAEIIALLKSEKAVEPLATAAPMILADSSKKESNMRTFSPPGIDGHERQFDPNDPLTGAWEFITPEKAKTYLDCKAPNRSLSSHTVKKYASDMKARAWIEKNHQGLAFDSSGRLIDGQHRCAALIQSGLPGLWMMVFRGVSEDVKLVLDQMRARSVHDSISLAFNGEFPKKISIFAGAALRSISQIWDGSQPTTSEVASFLKKYESELQEVASFPYIIPGTKYFGILPVMAVIFRGLFFIEKNRLKAFCEVLGSGIPKNAQEDGAALMYRNFLIRRPSYRKAGGGMKTIGSKT